ncbi:MAG: dihydroorotate dehydrogenase B catalytic subunit [Planctomycetes bacterium GWF2_42_9]|nr:MAG: dihydroorotate dehydrogenase B catalytic subunit [Planctomycetes bacterium GWF2_42_9]HAL45240.1 dihydroorotate dehydrogenase [Phycisphaerales bacterium]
MAINDKKIDLSIKLGSVSLKNPIMTASGTCGYVDELEDFLDINQLGGYITKSITIQPRLGNDVPRIVETDSGMLNAIGLANIGVEKFMQEKVPLMEHYKTPFFVNIAGREITDYIAVAEKLAKCKQIAGMELNISCPNVKQGGITFGTDPALVKQITCEVKKVVGDKILIVKLTPNVTNISTIAKIAVDCGADALSLINTFTAMVIDIETRKPVLANRTGGLSGPAIKPIAVYLVNKVYNEVAKPAGIPLIGGGGIRTASDAIEFIIAGATAVTIGTSSFINPDCSIKIIDGINGYCERHNVSSIAELTGSLK